MKTKLVLWGTNAQNERVLLALQLRPIENKVDIWAFPENVATEELGKQLMNEWRNGQDIPFPEGFTHWERELTISDGLLPDDLKVERGDLISRAQTEWHFVVLSAKLNQSYESELNELKEKIEQLKSFDNEVWDSLKTFWSKVQDQVRERNLFREHANNLRDNTNALFDRLKQMRSTLDEEFQKTSKEHMDSFMERLTDIEKRISEGMNLTVIFDELKKTQRKFRDSKFTREHRSKVWEKLDKAFKTVKEKRFGSNAYNESTPTERLKRRYDGLITAIQKMEKSIQRDQDDLNFQDRRIANSDGQLEAQIRQAKIKMIKERISSKEEKLGEMMQTKTELEDRMNKQKEKDAQQAEQNRIEQAKAAAKEKIAAKIEHDKEARKDDDEKLETAASSIKGEGENKAEENKTEESPSEAAPKAEPKESSDETLLSAISTTLGESLEDAIDTVKAVVGVVGEKIGDAIDEYTEKKEEEE